MLRHSLKMIVRNLFHHQVFSCINIFGLAIGMACTMLVLLWVFDELSYEKIFPDAEHTYLVLRGDNSGMTAVTSKMLSRVLKEEFPEISDATAFMQLPESFKFTIQRGEKGFEENVLLADSNFFEMFPFAFKEGNPVAALSAPNAIVITRAIATKYFGDEDPIGKPLTVMAFGSKTTATVSGVLESIPLQTQIQGQIILPSRWFQSAGIDFDRWEDQSFQTYIRVLGNGDLQSLSAQITQCEIRHFPNQNTTSLHYSLLPLTRIHLYGGSVKFLETTGNITYVQMFVVVALIILLIASINYMNLSTALSLKRTKEVGIRKAIGASRGALVLQFFGESFLLSCVAYGVSLLLVELCLHEFNLLAGKDLAIRFAEPSFLALSLTVIAITGVVAGSYPALLLSSFSPVQILNGKLRLGVGSLFTRKGLVVFQFVASIVIIVCTIVVAAQLSFIRNNNPGFDKANLLCIKMSRDANSRYEVLRNELLKNPDIESISRSEPVGGALTRTTGVDWTGKPANEERHFWVLHTDCSLARTYRFEMMMGRFFSEKYPSDQRDAFVINEAAAKSMGFTQPLDQDMQLWGKRGKIIGVVKDFHFASFHSAIEPLIFTMPDSSQQAARFRVITLRFTTGAAGNLLSSVERLWREQMPGSPLDYHFYDVALNAQYTSETRMGTIFAYFSFVSIMIACLGLFGLVSISVEQRTKEIGVRKVLGASAWNVASMISKDFLTLVIASNILAWPLAYYFMNAWLQGFAYRIGLGWWMFVIAGGIALMIALLTVSYHAIKATTSNPVDALRYE